MTLLKLMEGEIVVTKFLQKLKFKICLIEENNSAVKAEGLAL
jgi:hypothetical protein